MATISELALGTEVGHCVLDALLEIATGYVLESRQVSIYDCLLCCVLLTLARADGELRAGYDVVGMRSAHGACLGSRLEFFVRWLGCGGGGSPIADAFYLGIRQLACRSERHTETEAVIAVEQQTKRIRSLEADRAHLGSRTGGRAPVKGGRWSCRVS